MSWIVKNEEKDEATKALEAKIAENQAYLDEQKAKVAAMSEEELAAHNAEVEKKFREFYAKPENQRYIR